MNDKDNNIEKVENSENEMTDSIGFDVSGHILIRDKETGEELVNKRNAIHYGNLGYLISQALGNQDNKIIHFMAFGNGATSVDSSGKVIYKSTNTSESRETSASLYRKTFAKVVSNTAQNSDQASNKLEVIEGSGFTDMKITCTLGLNEPSGQQSFDTSSNNEGDFIFDELGLISYVDGANATTASTSGDLLTHVIFHPVQKSLNRIIEVVYTLRIQMT
tara:strand:- start:103 stop:759 length:657 start_codon:yes stop_codon:yes gene_type:complete